MGDPICGHIVRSQQALENGYPGPEMAEKTVKGESRRRAA